jgi:hypothetical protein
MARRLDVHTAPARFLGADDDAFCEAMTRLSPALASPAGNYADDVARVVAHMNIAGLCDREKRNWYEWLSSPRALSLPG